jgi:SAM-dependent methyltransferase
MWVRSKSRRSARTSVPVVTWQDANEPRTIEVPCPNCDAIVGKTPALTVSWQTLNNPARESELLHCPACTCRFYRDQSVPDYAAPGLLDYGRVPFYVQQGAGISLITHPLTRLTRPTGSRYVEVGCGFGFALDFAVRARGWRGHGIDPSALSELGGRQLGLDITLGYLHEQNLLAEYDIVMSAETIEHVPSPLGFVHALRGRLKPDGILVLTTPDADRIRRSTPPATLVGLLSPGLHLVFQSEPSLRALLHRAGFVNVVIERLGAALVAYASDVEIMLADSEVSLREQYRAYLEARAHDQADERDLFFGFAGRAYQEAVNDADWAAAERLWSLLAAACERYFCLNLDAPSNFPHDLLRGNLEAIAERAPLGLAGILYCRAQHRLACGGSRAEVEAQLLAATSAAHELLRALGELALSDALTEVVGWTAQAEAALCGASRNPSECVERLLGLPPAPDLEPTAERRRDFLARGVVELVNRRHYAQARMLATSARLHIDPAIPASNPAQQDLLFCLGVLDLQLRGNAERARAYFEAVRHALTSHERPDAARTALLWAALRGELQAITKRDGAAAAERHRSRVIGQLAALVPIPEELGGGGSSAR